MDRRRGQVSHVGGRLEAVASKSSSGARTYQSTNQQFLTQEVSHTSSSNPMRGYNNSAYRGILADEYPPAGTGRPAKTPSTGSSTQSLIDSMNAMGQPEIAQGFYKATKTAKSLSSRDDPIEGQPYYRRDQYYTAQGMHDYEEYKKAEDGREGPSGRAAAAWGPAPKGTSKNHNPELSRVNVVAQREFRDASLKWVTLMLRSSVPFARAPLLTMVL